MEKETELGALVVAWLKEQHWDVYQEVMFGHYGGVADIVAVRNGIMWIIECKLSYCFTVLEQASRWPAHYRSIAVPFSRTPRDYRVAKDYYLVGVLEVDPVSDYRGGVYERIQPKLFVHNHKQVKKYLALLTELHKTYAMAGSDRGDHLTPYKQTMIDVRRYVESHPGCTIKNLFEEYGSMHYSSAASFKGNIIKALAQFEPWCKIDTSTVPYRLFVKQPEASL
jgi:hypothetical protein